MELKVMPFVVSAFDPTGRTVEGYAAVFGNVDRVDDVIVKGAFAKTLTERGGKVRFLWQHKQEEVIGRPIEMREDDQGLYVKAIISDTARGRDALALLRDGAINEMSIGYDPLPAQIEYAKMTLPDGQIKTVRRLKEIKLWEFSLVSFAANPEAVVTALKGAPGASEIKAEWDAAYINDLDDDAFLYIAAGGKKDDDGKTVPRALRYFPVRNREGDPDRAHLANALARIPQSSAPGLTDAKKRTLQEQARAMLDDLKEESESEKEFPMNMETKYGRALSGTNRKRLSTRITEIKSAVEDLGKLLDETRDDLDDAQERAAQAEGDVALSGKPNPDDAKCNTGKRREEEKALNLSQRVEKVGAAFRALYNRPNEWGPWHVVDVYDEYLVVRSNEDNATCAVPYTLDADGNATIRPRAEWTPGEYTFTPRAATQPASGAVGETITTPAETPAMETAGLSKNEPITNAAGNGHAARDNAGPNASQTEAGPGLKGTPPTDSDDMALTLRLQLMQTELSLLEV